MGAVVGHQHAVAVEVGAIQHQVPVDLTGGFRCWWGDIPAPLDAPLKCFGVDMGGFVAGE